MTTDDLMRELLGEIRKDREARQFLEVQVSNCTRAVIVLSNELQEFRKLVFEGEANTLERIRQVADFAGMTYPADRNGGG